MLTVKLNGTKDADLSDGDQTDYLYNGYEQTGVDPNTNEPILSKKYNYDNYFLDQVISTGNGAAAEAVARMAVYGGAPQAALKCYRCTLWYWLCTLQSDRRWQHPRCCSVVSPSL